MSKLSAKKELNRRGWVRKQGLWSKKDGTTPVPLDLAGACAAAGITI